MSFFYAAVEGDPLDSGTESHVISTANVGTIADGTGRPRRMAFIGDAAWCAACKSMGVIVGGAPVRAGGRMVDNVNGGRLQAVGGDEIHCKCAQAPRIIAVYGRSWTIQNNSDSETRTVASRATSQSAPSVIYDEQFTLKDGNGMPLPDTYYTIRLPSGELAHGVTDSQGRTERYPTSDAQQISIPVGHNREH